MGNRELRLVADGRARTPSAPLQALMLLQVSALQGQHAGDRVTWRLRPVYALGMPLVGALVSNVLYWTGGFAEA